MWFWYFNWSFCSKTGLVTFYCVLDIKYSFHHWVIIYTVWLLSFLLYTTGSFIHFKYLQNINGQCSAEISGWLHWNAAAMLLLFRLDTVDIAIHIQAVCTYNLMKLQVIDTSYLLYWWSAAKGREPHCMKTVFDNRSKRFFMLI